MSKAKIFSRNFVLCFFAQFAFSGVFFALTPTIPIYLSTLGTRESEIGILIGVSSFFSLVLRPFVGRALSRTPEKKFLFHGSLILALSVTLMLWAPPFWPLLTARALQGIGAALFFTSSFTLIANISPQDHQGQSLGIYYISINVAFALAPSLAMMLIHAYPFPFGFKILFLTCGGFALCSGLLISNLEGKTPDTEKHPPSEAQPLLSRGAIPPAMMAALANVIWGSVIAFFPLYAMRHGITNSGPFFTAFAIMLMLGRGLGGKILDLYARKRHKVILPCLASYTAAMILLAFSSTLPLFILAAIIWGIGNALFYPLLIMYALDLSGSNRGPAMGTFSAIADLGTGLGPVIMGILLHWTNYRVLFLCLALVSVLNFFYYQFSVRRKGA